MVKHTHTHTHTHIRAAEQFTIIIKKNLIRNQLEKEQKWNRGQTESLSLTLNVS